MKGGLSEPKRQLPFWRPALFDREGAEQIGPACIELFLIGCQVTPASQMRLWTAAKKFRQMQLMAADTLMVHQMLNATAAAALLLRLACMRAILASPGYRDGAV